MVDRVKGFAGVKEEDEVLLFRVERCIITLCDRADAYVVEAITPRDEAFLVAWSTRASTGPMIRASSLARMRLSALTVGDRNRACIMDEIRVVFRYEVE